jgi:hypothetical protein
MIEETKQWTWSDGWILMSVYLTQSKNKATLADVIAAADATNHAIPTPNELTHAFTKLVNLGVLSIEKNSYKISTEYFTEIEKAYKTKGGLFESANKGKKWLMKSGLQPIQSPKVTITENEVHVAYNEYTSRIKQKG